MLRGRLFARINFFDFFGYFFVKQSGGSSMESTGMDDNWLTMEARLRLKTKDHTWVDLSTGLLPFLIILKDIKVYSLFGYILSKISVWQIRTLLSGHCCCGTAPVGPWGWCRN